MSNVYTNNIKGATLKAIICEVVECVTGKYNTNIVYVLPAAFEEFYNGLVANENVFIEINKVVYEWTGENLYGMSKYSESWASKRTYWNGKFHQIARVVTGSSETTVFANQNLY